MLIHNFLDKNSIFIVIAISFVALGINVPAEHSSSTLAPVLTLEPVCDNYNEIEDFEKSIPIVWTAKMDGCLVSCEGASFTRVPGDEKYPRFAGYFAGLLGPELRQDNAILKISGDWIGIGADHPYTVFDNKCVPVIQINKIEVI